MIVWCGHCEERTVPYNPKVNGDIDITAQRPPCIVCSIDMTYRIAVAAAQRNGIGVPMAYPDQQPHFVAAVHHHAQPEPNGCVTIECTCGVRSVGDNEYTARRVHEVHRAWAFAPNPPPHDTYGYGRTGEGVNWLRARGFLVATCARGCGLPVAGKGDVCGMAGCEQRPYRCPHGLTGAIYCPQCGECVCKACHP